MTLRALFVFGTRPEAIKMAPLVHECQRRAAEVKALVCLTGQHREMLRQVTSYFEIAADVNLDLMRPDQTLPQLTARCIEALDEVLAAQSPHCVVVQGDTTTVLAASLAAFYRRLPVVHVEAGLRTGNLYAPWPEEMNRRVASIMTALHCAPTTRSADNLLREGYSPATVHVTGNTVIDALLWTVQRERARHAHWQQQHTWIEDRRMVLITGHRRESFGEPFRQICRAINQLAQRFPDVAFLYPVHLNPNVQAPVRQLLGDTPNVRLVPPVPYPEFVWLMDRCTVLLSDSGGVQEEAPSLRKPLLVMRETTERPEAVEAGAVELVGTDADRIVARGTALLQDPEEYARHQISANPYGDGTAAKRIVDLMLQQGWQS